MLIQGPAGAVGAVGPEGPSGNRGDTGSQGVQGPPGNDGAPVSFVTLGIVIQWIKTPVRLSLQDRG